MRSRAINPETLTPDRLKDLEDFNSKTLPGLLARVSANLAAKLTAATLHQVFTYAGIGAFSSSTPALVLTITWPKPFADTQYTVVCDIVPPSGSSAVLTTHASSKTTTGCSITVYAGGATVPAGAVATIDGIHL